MPDAPDALAAALFLIACFVAAGFVHTAWLRSPWSRALAIPVDGGRTWRRRRIFGENKTWRGFAAMIPAASLCFAAGAGIQDATDVHLWDLSVIEYAWLGAWAGFGFMAAELPNSFVKRQLGIRPGMAPHTRLGAATCFVVDRLDSIVGMLAAVSLAVPMAAMTWGWVLLIGPGIHLSFSVLLHRLGLKARPA